MTAFEQIIREKQNEMLYTGKTTLEREDLETLLNSTTETKELCGKVTDECGDISIECGRIEKLVPNICLKLGDILKQAQEKELPKEYIDFLSLQIEAIKTGMKTIEKSNGSILESSEILSDKAFKIGFSE